jgi:hypothetical protein
MQFNRLKTRYGPLVPKQQKPSFEPVNPRYAGIKNNDEFLKTESTRSRMNKKAHAV